MNLQFLYLPPETLRVIPVIVEALAYSLPIISTNKGALLIVLLIKNGFIKSNSPKEIALKIELLLKDKHLISKMKKESRKIYEEKFTEDIMISNYVNMFEQVLKFDKYNNK